ncbi:MAG: hypothetical protein RID59_09870 [Hoeflea sp.]
MRKGGVMTSKAFYSLRRWVFALIVLLLGFALPAAAQGDGLAMLDNLARGEWTIKPRDGSAERKVCVRSGEELIQLRHEGRDCNRFVVEDQPSEVTVQYTCPGNGYGRTNIRRETNALVQIESQGIASGLPFEFSAEARRTGSC